MIGNARRARRERAFDGDARRADAQDERRVDEARLELDVAEVVLDGEHVVPDRVPVEAKRPADRRDDVGAADVCDERRALCDAQAHDVRVGVDERRDGRLRAGAIAAGERAEQRREAFDLALVGSDLRARELAVVDLLGDRAGGLRERFRRGRAAALRGRLGCSSGPTRRTRRARAQSASAASAADAGEVGDREPSSRRPCAITSPAGCRARCGAGRSSRRRAWDRRRPRARPRAAGDRRRSPA